MAFNKKDIKNLLLNQILSDGSSGFSINELVPTFTNNLDDTKFLSYDDGIHWSSIKSSDHITVSSLNGDLILDVSLGDPFEGSEMFFRDGQIGVGRLPLHNYKVDISVPVNTRMTALHFGDGVHGLSFGNATNEGFLPQIIGIGSDEDDAGIYMLGKVSKDSDSRIPAIILDGRSFTNTPLIDRPILGVTSGSYSEYKLVVEANGRVGIGILPGIYKLNIDGVLRASNIVIEDPSSGILDLRSEIEKLKEQIEILKQKL